MMFSIISEKIWDSDWFMTLMVGIILLLIAQFNLLQPLEQLAYDWSIRQMTRNPGDKVAVIAIDEQSVAKLGDLPWQRTVLAQMIDLLAEHSQVIGTNLDFTKEQKVLGQIYIDELLTFYANTKPFNLLHKQLEQWNSLMDKFSQVRVRYSKDRKYVKQLYDFYKSSVLVNELPNTLTKFEEKLQATRIDLNSDQRLAHSFKQAGHVVLAMPLFWNQSNVTNETLAPYLPDYMQKHRLKAIRIPFDSPVQISQPLLGVNAIPPLAIFANSVSGIGYMNSEPHHFDSRRIPLVMKYKNAYFPSLPLLLAAKSKQLTNNQIEVRLGKGIRLDNLRINTDSSLLMRPFFYHDMPVDSFADVLLGHIPAEKYQNKIVLLGVTDFRYSVWHSTPLGKMPSLLILAHTLTSLLNQDFLKKPDWAIWLQVGTFLLVIFYLSLLLPRLKLRTAVIASSGLVIMLFFWYFSLLNQGLLVQLMLPIWFVPCGHLGLQLKRGIVAYQDAFRLHPDAVESNRLLGLAFQGQGHLDLAFEKFRQCPPDEAIMSLLYNLALDYERKRQFRRASAVFRYMISYHPTFRDIEQRLERLRRLRIPQLSRNLNDWLLEEGNDKPILGRYQIEKPLGKGAMGVVYLGKDSKLDRLVAIKTLPLSQEFEAEELQEATIWFFQEAAAAGRLSHPHIISIYDAGEEQDLAYISMEFVKGGNLVPYTQAENLLPISTVVEIMIHAAEALDYAHSQGVIHRDIKPANLMYNPATGQIKITDFGIARITDSNKTKTGTILGTPSYMSPEQLAGKPLDGRSDLFSLSVTLYQLLTGKLPFVGKSLPSLMFQITHEIPPDIRTIRSEIPVCLKQVVEVALQKEVNARYQSGIQFADALRDCNNRGEF